MPSSSPIKKLQQRIEELIVQLDLGKLEALDYIEEHKGQLCTLANKCAQSTREATTQALRKRLDELKVQLQLGKMESKDAYLAQLRKIEAALTAATQAMKEAKHGAEQEFGEAAQALSDKVHLLAINLAALGIIAQEEAVKAKGKLRTQLTGLAGTLRASKEVAGEKARKAAEEGRAAFDDIRSNLRSLVR